MSPPVPRVCLVVPVRDHRQPLRGLLEGLAKLDLPCLVIDAGGDPLLAPRLADACADQAWLEVHRCRIRRGTAAALRAGLRLAAWQGYDHAIVVGADGQCDPSELPRLLEALRGRESALVLVEPCTEARPGALRRAGRALARWPLRLAAGGPVGDPWASPRALPLAATRAALERCGSSEERAFELELALRIAWSVAPVRRLPLRAARPAATPRRMRGALGLVGWWLAGSLASAARRIAGLAPGEPAGALRARKDTGRPRVARPPRPRITSSG